MKDISVVVLAAGEGKRMKSNKSKVLAEVLFKPMINWVVDSCLKLGLSCTNICVVTPEDNHGIVEATENKFVYVVQKERLGTAHAVAQARDFINKTESNNILLMLGDAPFVSSDILKNFCDHHVERDNSLTILSSDVKDPTGYGRIIRDADNSENLLKIVEEVDCDDFEKQVEEINSGVMCFKKDALLMALDSIDNDNLKQEYYITSAVEILLTKNKKVGAFNCFDEKVVLGANTRFQLLQMNEIARRSEIERLADSGVEFVSFDGVVIEPGVEIGEGSVVFPNVVLKKNTKIGKNCTVTSNSHIENTRIGDNVVIKSSYIENSEIGNNVKIGPFSNIRPNSLIKDNVKIGDFVEIKNSSVDEGTSVAHLTYVGDSDVGKKVNFGCGCVTVNYDGKKKFRTVIGDNCFIGCNTNLIAPVKIGDGAYTAAGSTVTEDVPENSMCIARSRQVVKKDWKLKN